MPNQVDARNPDKHRLGVLFNWIDIQPIRKKSLIGSGVDTSSADSRVAIESSSKKVICLTPLPSAR